jgi:hypothetical protein
MVTELEIYFHNHKHIFSIYIVITVISFVEIPSSFYYGSRTMLSLENRLATQNILL